MGQMIAAQSPRLIMAGKLCSCSFFFRKWNNIPSAIVAAKQAGGHAGVYLDYFTLQIHTSIYGWMY
jgi:hypothetical protein